LEFILSRAVFEPEMSEVEEFGIIRSEVNERPRINEFLAFGSTFSKVSSSDRSEIYSPFLLPNLLGRDPSEPVEVLSIRGNGCTGGTEENGL
jgi:hypothetical protein